MDVYTDQFDSLEPSFDLACSTLATLELISRDRRHRRPCDLRRQQREAAIGWTQGLKKRTANALLAHGFTSREQVARAPARRLRRVANLGVASMQDLVRWLAR